MTQLGWNYEFKLCEQEGILEMLSSEWHTDDVLAPCSRAHGSTHG